MLVGFLTTLIIFSKSGIATKYEHQSESFTDPFTTVTKYKSHFFISFCNASEFLEDNAMLLEKGPYIAVLLGMGREGVNGSFHRQEKLMRLSNKNWKLI